MWYEAHYASPLGDLCLASDGEALTGLWMEEQKYGRATVEGEGIPRADLLLFAAAADWLDRYFRGEKPPVSDLPLAPKGSAFRQEVWRLLCAIPYGETRTYGDLAAELAIKLGREHMSSQAVGGAVGHNPISIVIPCHRVVGADGSLTGYAGGVDRKVRLLELEGADLSHLYLPKTGTAL